jgi:hypothetical protein
MAIRQKVFADFTGGLNNVNNKDTINNGTTRTESPDMMNVEYLGLGGIRTMEGNFQVGDVQDSSIVGGWEYRKGNDKYMIIATQHGDIKIYNPATDEFDLIYSFIHPSNRVSFCNMNNGVVVTNGIDDLIFYEKGRKKILSGTVNIVEGSVDVSGSGTLFETELKPGDSIQIGNGVYYVDNIENDLSLTLRDTVDETLTSANIYLSEVSECNAVLTNEEDPNVSTPIRGTAIQYYKGRLWIGGDNGLFYSQVGLYNGWDIAYDAGVLYSVYNDTSEIKALGLFSDFLMIHKEFSSYILTITDVGTTIEVQPYTNISCDSQQSWIVSNTKYYIYSAENMGIYPIGQRTVFSDRFVGEEISTKVRGLFQRIRTFDTDKIFAVTLPNKRWMMFYLPLVDGIGSNNVLIYDFQTKSWLYRKVPQNVTIAFNYNNYVYIGTADGKVLREFSGATFDGETIVSYYKMPWQAWFQGYRQSFAEFVVELDNEYNNQFYIRTFKDGLVRHEDRIITSDVLLGDGLIWAGDEENDNNFTYWDEDQWVDTGFKYIRMVLPNNVFEDFQVEIGTNQPGQSFAFYSLSFRRIEADEAPW